MPAIADAAAQARLFARRGADAAAVVLGASFHPFRTVREGAHLVQGLMNPPEQVTPTPPGTDTAIDMPAASTASPKPKPDTKPAPGPQTVAKDPAPPVADPEIPADADVPVDPTGPLPHIPPRIASEVERDYGDELPGIKDWED